MNYYLFRLVEGTEISDAEKDLRKKGLKGIYVIEDDSNGDVFIGGYGRKKIESTKLILVEEKKAEIDWEEQWSLFAENFTEGKAHIDLSQFGVEKTLLLAPGAGFGDLSHPTTYLMLEMMSSFVKGQTVVDIGTGSGILSLAALLLGAKSAIGIDIDENALKHAQQNALLNGLESRVLFCKTLPKKLDSGIFLMNMIFPEQKIFSPKKYNRFAKYWIVSGILAEQRGEYLAQAHEWNWELIEEHSRSEWIGCVFQNEPRPRGPWRSAGGTSEWEGLGLCMVGPSFELGPSRFLKNPALGAREEVPGALRNGKGRVSSKRIKCKAALHRLPLYIMPPKSPMPPMPIPPIPPMPPIPGATAP